MKNKLFIVALMVVAITALFAGTAFAATGSTYTLWSEASAATSAGPSPHASYYTTTKNCAVCHAVHNAATGGQVLLKSTIAGACDFCHVSSTTSYTKVYAGVSTNYSSDTIYNHSSAGGATCVACHAVHGAQTAWSASGSPFILKLTAGSGTFQGAGPTSESTSTQLGISLWCTACHTYYTTAHNGTSHVMATQSTDFRSVNNSASSSLTGVQVAWASSSVCQGCHTAGKPVAAMDFPHYTPGAPRFITSGIANAGQTAVNNDGVCLTCHVNGGSGVGKTF